MLAQISAHFASQAGSQSITPGTGTRKEPLAENMIFLDAEHPTEDESYVDGCKWFKTIINLTEVVFPGASPILKTALGNKDPITPSVMAGAENLTMVSNLSREIHGLLYLKTRGKARTHVEQLDVHLGLEALRAIKGNLFRMDAKKLKLEYDQLTNLCSIDERDMRHVDTPISTWESDLDRVERLDPDYACGKHQRRQILFKALPQDVRQTIETEEAMGRLQTYEIFITYVRTISSSSLYNKNEKVKPLLGNNNEQEQAAPPAPPPPEPEPPQQPHDEPAGE